MTVRMRMVLTIDVEAPQDDIEEAFIPIREKLIKMGLRPRAWKVSDLDADDMIARQREEEARARRALSRLHRRGK